MNNAHFINYVMINDMTKHETRAIYENMIESFLQRNAIKRYAINERALRTIDIERAIRNDDTYRAHIQ